MKYQKHTLKNGLRILLAPMQETGTATVIVMTGVGSRYETRAENGLAHFLEHMFFKGTTKRPTAMDISKELDAIGAEYNAYTGKDRTAYYAKVEAHHWETALDVVSDLFLNAKIEQEEIDRERGPVLQELNMYEDMPMRHIGDLWELHLYGDHPLGWEIIGPKKNIQTLMRKDFIKYLNRGYVAENVVIGVAGKIDPKAVKKEIEKHFAKIRTGKKPMFKKNTKKQSQPEVFVQNKKTDQTQLIVGVRSYDMNHKDKYVLAVLSIILGGGMSSRLFMAVRERRGLAYSVHTMTESFHDAGYLATQAGVEHVNLEKTIKVILDEYQKIATEKVAADELKKAKEYIKGKMAMGLEGSDDVVEYLVTQETIRGEIVLPKEKAKLVDRVTAEDVLRVAKDIFVNKKLNLAVIGPKASKQKLIKIVTLG
ncbi:MAG: pitrilysin family protein [Candidatus Moraniibacteriota bacterium]